jgi:hypothetical protein
LPGARSNRSTLRTMDVTLKTLLRAKRFTNECFPECLWKTALSSLCEAIDSACFCSPVQLVLTKAGQRDFNRKIIHLSQQFPHSLHAGNE